MANWSKNNEACKVTWSTLMVLEQFRKVFKDAGDLKMKQLTFFNQTASPDQRESVARVLCIQMDNIFRKFHSARFEDGIEVEQAIGAMKGILTNGDATVAELAEKCDVSYKFYGEEDDGI